MRRLSRSKHPTGQQRRKDVVVIRPPKQSEATIFLSLVDALADFEKLKRPTRSARERLLRDGFGKKKRFFPLLAFVNRIPVGYAILFESYSSFLARPTLYLEDIFILPAYRGKGIGLSLFRYCVAEAKRRRCGRMEWCVLDWNKNAIRFYDAYGATRMKNWWLYRITF